MAPMKNVSSDGIPAIRSKRLLPNNYALICDFAEEISEKRKLDEGLFFE